MIEQAGLDMLGIALNVLSGAMIMAGAFFILVGAIGIIRMPDVFTRMHAASVMETAGAGFLLIGLMIQAGPTLLALKLAFVLALFLLTAPVAAHALAQAALSAGPEPQLSEDRRDDRGSAQTDDNQNKVEES